MLRTASETGLATPCNEHKIDVMPSVERTSIDWPRPDHTGVSMSHNTIAQRYITTTADGGQCIFKQNTKGLPSCKSRQRGHGKYARMLL